MTLVYALILLGILVFIHELGHFVVAKRAGVGVTTFSLGFGPRLFGFKRGITDYRVSAFPLGGYVRMVGEDPSEEVPDDQKAISFVDKPVGWRIAIVAAGALCNILFALVLTYILFSFYGIPTVTARIGEVMAGLPAEKAGLLPGDLVTRVEGSPVATWIELDEAVQASHGRPFALTVKREGKHLQLKVAPLAVEGGGRFTIGIVPFLSTLVDQVMPGMPADRAGVRPGDVIRGIDGKPVTHWDEVARAVKSSGGKALTFVLDRGGETLSLLLKPKEVTDKPAAGHETKVFRIGIMGGAERIFKPVGALEAVGHAFSGTLFAVRTVVGVVIKLVQREESMKNVGGPILIGQAAGQAAERGLRAFLSIMAMISVNLGVLNLLPIPVLDGGHLVFFLIEAVLRKPVSLKIRQRFQQMGMAALLFLMVVVFYNDIERLIFGAAN